jgi:hypothetical protein
MQAKSGITEFIDRQILGGGSWYRPATDGTWNGLTDVSTTAVNNQAAATGTGTTTTSTAGTTVTTTGTSAKGDVTPTLIDKATEVFTKARASSWFWPVVILVAVWAFMGKIKIKI